MELTIYCQLGHSLNEGFLLVFINNLGRSLSFFAWFAYNFPRLSTGSCHLFSFQTEEGYPIEMTSQALALCLGLLLLD